MKTWYDIDEIVYVPYRIKQIRIEPNGKTLYKMYSLVNKFEPAELEEYEIRSCCYKSDCLKAEE